MVPCISFSQCTLEMTLRLRSDDAVMVTEGVSIRSTNKQHTLSLIFRTREYERATHTLSLILTLSYRYVTSCTDYLWRNSTRDPRQLCKRARASANPVCVLARVEQVR